MTPSPSDRVSFYDDLAEWWPLFSPPADYAEEAEDIAARFSPSTRKRRLLELGCGGGNLASHLKNRFDLTLTDRAAGMLAHSKVLNPEARHMQGDMRDLRLAERFDVVLIHDAVMYATTANDLDATLGTAAAHLGEDGVALVLPDYVLETFEPGTEEGGEDSPDGRGLRYLEWRFDPDPSDGTYVVDYAFLLRERDGSTRVFHDRHVEGLFSRAAWLASFERAGLVATASTDRWGRVVFLARRVA